MVSKFNYLIKMYYYALVAIPILLGCRWITGSDTRIGKYYRYKSRKWKELKTMVSGQYSSTYDIYRVSWQMILQATYQDILSFFDNRLEKKSKKMYELTYMVEGQMYKMPIKVRRGPSKIFSAEDEHGNCILLKLKQYRSPAGTIINPLVTPKYLGYEKIILNMTKTFSGDEPITIND